jgi:DNA mismatch repair ATPase MutS
MTYINWIRSNLRIEDLPGSESLFEREVSFAANTLNTNGNGLILIDELFHSTNPNDSIKASNIYLHKLWSKTNILSIISTHIFELVEKSPNSIKKICCPADELEDGTIIYKYGLNDGICKISSVNDILKEKCLCA